MRARSNPAAPLSILFGLLAVLAVPAGVVGARYVPSVRLLDGLYAGVPAALVLAALALFAARRARRRFDLTLERSGGSRATRAGRALGLLGIYAGTTGALALAVYALLRARS